MTVTSLADYAEMGSVSVKMGPEEIHSFSRCV